jgi:hypothetical protein
MKYIIEIPDDVQYVLLNGKADNKYYTAVRPIAELEELNSDYINEHYGELQDEAYRRGLEDAWEAAQKVVCKTTAGGMSLDTLKEIFGVQSPAAIMQSNTAQQAIAKLKAYEDKQKDRIEVGDIVERYIDGKLDSKGIYLQEDGGYWRCLFDTGAVLMTFAYPKGQFKKTGKHYDIQSVLEAMRTHD